MRSFAITAFATLAFGIFCSAAPIPQDDNLLDVDILADVDVLKRGAEEYTNYTTSYSTSTSTSYSTLYSTSTSTSYYPSSTSYSSSSEDKCLESVIEGAVTEITKILDEISETLSFFRFHIACH